ncbi:MAG: PolC-type DNA polymerase III [Gemmatimonadota bacterium]
MPEGPGAAGSAGGLRFAADSVLVARALAAVGRGPRPTADLAREVFGLRNAPEGVAARLVYELLRGDGRMQVDASGCWSLVRETPSLDARPLDGLDYVVVDVETTGSRPSAGDRVIEFAAVPVIAGRPGPTYETLVNPGCGIPPGITRLTGISAPMLARAPRFGAVSEAVRERLEGRVFVAHNVQFDWRFVSEEMRLSRSVLPEGPRLCTLRLARRVLPGLRRRGLDSVAAYYGIEIRGRHRAGGDARATAEVLVRMLEEASRQGIQRWGELQDWLFARRRRGKGRT